MKQVSFPAKLAYGVGIAPVSIKNMLFHFFFLYFFTNVLGVSELLVIAAVMIALIVDAFTDPIMGQISDNARSRKWGRRHQFMLMGVLPTMLGLIALFSPPSGLGQAGLFIWMLTFLIVVRMGLTVYAVPHSALGTDLSTDYDERTAIVGIRELFNNIFTVSVFIFGFIVFFPPSPEFEDPMLNIAGYAPFTTTMAIIGGIAALLSILATRHKVSDIRRYENDARTSWRSAFTQLREAAKIKPFRWLATAYCSILTLYATGSALSLYIGGYLWQFTNPQKAAIAVSPILMIIPVVIAANLLSKWMDKKRAVVLFALIYILFSVLPYALYFAGLMPPIFDPNLFNIIIVMHVLGFAGLLGVGIIANSMLADISDLMDARTGKRQEGVLNSAFSFVQKLTFIIGTVIGALSLVIIKFPKGAQPSETPQSAIDGLPVAAIATSLLFAALGIYAFMRYTLTRDTVSAIQAQLPDIG